LVALGPIDAVAVGAAVDVDIDGTSALAVFSDSHDDLRTSDWIDRPGAPIATYPTRIVHGIVSVAGLPPVSVIAGS
jgi:hypothetical protein